MLAWYKFVVSDVFTFVFCPLMLSLFHFRFLMDLVWIVEICIFLKDATRHVYLLVPALVKAYKIKGIVFKAKILHCEAMLGRGQAGIINTNHAPGENLTDP